MVSDAGTGLTTLCSGGGPRLCAADSTAGTVDVDDGAFRQGVTPGTSTDPRLPAGYAPFDVAVLGGKLHVADAEQGATRGFEQDGKGLGRVDIFTPGGVLLRRLADSGALDALWGLTIAPTGFGRFGGDLLVGNVGDGRIHAHDAHTVAPRGTLLNSHGHPLAVDGLWALTPGNGVEDARPGRPHRRHRRGRARTARDHQHPQVITSAGPPVTDRSGDRGPDP